VTKSFGIALLGSIGIDATPQDGDGVALNDEDCIEI
jgi:hypothetical protein